MAIKAVIFDLDGTITEPYFDFDVIRKEMGLGHKDESVLDAMRKMGPIDHKRCADILRAHEQMAVVKSSLNPGTRELLSGLANSGIKAGILTRNLKANALAVAAKHDLQFDVFLGREDAPAKPEADGVLQICEQFNVKPAETLMVGDYLYDLLCAKAAGAIGVLLANHERADEFAEHADFVIEKIDEILHIIEEKNND